MTTKQRAAAGQVDEDLDPMAQVEADIAEADAKIRKARHEAAVARRAAGIRHGYRAHTVVLWLDPAGHWHKVFGAKLTIPRPTVSALHVLIEFLLDSFHLLSQEYQLCAAAVAENPETGRHVVAYGQIGPTR